MFVGDNTRGKKSNNQEVEGHLRSIQLEQVEAYLKRQNEELGRILDMANKWRQQMLQVTEEIHHGYRRLMQMYTISFAVGIALIAGGIISSLVYRENLVAIALGGFGTADIVVYFLKKPAQSLQDSRSNLTQLQAAFYNWFSDVFNWNAYLSQRQQAITFDELNKVSNVLWKNTEIMMKLVNRYCETGKGIKQPSIESSKEK